MEASPSMPIHCQWHLHANSNFVARLSCLTSFDSSLQILISNIRRVVASCHIPGYIRCLDQSAGYCLVGLADEGQLEMYCGLIKPITALAKDCTFNSFILILRRCHSSPIIEDMVDCWLTPLRCALAQETPTRKDSKVFLKLECILYVTSEVWHHVLNFVTS